MEIFDSETRTEFRKTRKYNEITLQQMADRLGVSNVHLSRVEGGVVQPSTELFARMCKAYGLDRQCPTCLGKGWVG